MALLDSRNLVISGSIVIAMILVLGAYIASGRHVPVLTVSAESTEEILKEYAAKDSDKDGLPDWQEALYGTDPENPNSVRADITDSQAVAQGLATPRYAGQSIPITAGGEPISVPGIVAAPDSLTEQFSRLFFENYLSTRGSEVPSAQASQQFVTSAVSELVASRSQVNAYSAEDIKVSGSGAGALRAYAAVAESTILSRNPGHDAGTVAYFQDAVQKDDKEALKKVGEIGRAVESAAKALTLINVPSEAAAAHLTFVNAMAGLAKSTLDLAAFDTDPLRAMVGLGLYEQSVQEYGAAYKAVYQVFASAGVTLSAGEPGYEFYTFAQSAANLY